MEANEPEATRLEWIDPVDAYARVRAAGHEAIVLLGDGAHPDARWSFVATTFADEIRIHGSRLTRAPPNAAPTTTPFSLAALQRILDETPRTRASAVPFRGGWIGVVGYEFACLLDPTLPRPKQPVATPDLWLRRAEDVIAFDRDNGEATLWSTPTSGGGAVDQRRARLRGALARASPTRQPIETSAPVWSTSLDEAGFTQRVLYLKGWVADGDHFQANLATRFSTAWEGDAVELLRNLRTANPSPYMGLVEAGDFTLVSGSPELLVRFSHGVVTSRPIAGTRKRGGTAADDAAMEEDLRSDEKEQAEHTMLVDLVRNDVAKVAVPGTVRVPERMSVERYRHVMHLASRVEAQARPGTTALEVLAALFPGGTITGAPKHRAMQRIHEAEPVPRGLYTGALGFIDASGSCCWNILIRSAVIRGGELLVHAGSGIVADSVAAREWKEAGRKAQALLDAANGRTNAGGTRLGEVTQYDAWSPPSPARRLAARVLLIDNFDSFVHNLADYCAALGAAVSVVRNDADWRRAVADFAPTHVILGPGPGWPREAGCSIEVARKLHGRLPLLGVCLGHQAIAEAHGGRVRRHAGGPVHGKVADILHEGSRLFAGLRSPLPATRYHSLVVDPPPGAAWQVTAKLADGTVMALQHTTAPTVGLQFHPESLCTDTGLELIARFLELRP